MIRFLLWFLATTIVSATLHGVLYHRLRARGAPRSIGAWLLAAFLLGPIGRLLVVRDVFHGSAAWVEAVAMIELLGLLVCIPILLAADALIALRASREPSSERRVALEQAGALGVAALAGFAPPIFGVLRGRRELDVVELPVRLAKLPRALDGYTIVQVSDIHVGTFLDEHDLARIAERVRALRADLIVMTGDLVHNHVRHIPPAVQWLARLAAGARHGAAAIPGNHEHYVGRDAVLSAIGTTGVRVLLDRHVCIAKDDGGGFLLGGVEDAFHGSYPSRAFLDAPSDRLRILLAHQPQVAAEASKIGVDLQLSGHTHGGQIRPVGPLVAGVLYPWVAGRYVVGPTTLYVNRGLGTSGPPTRVGIPPEITKIILVAG